MLYILHMLRLPVFLVAGYTGALVYMVVLHRILAHKAATLKEQV